ncbi:MAG: hypothetical protein OXD32_04665, partial [Endozoicomonadaceae bacterium]|nr:hypothetical protein [Endozoicomonadaceae bacterium]
MNKIKIIFLLAVFSLYTLCNNIFANVNCQTGGKCIGYKTTMSCDTGSTCIGYQSQMSCDTGATCTNFGPQKPHCDASSPGGCKNFPVPLNSQIVEFFKKAKSIFPYECSNADIRAPVNGGFCVFLNATPGKVEQTLNNLLKIHAYECQYLNEHKLNTECILNMGISVAILYNAVHSSSYLYK